MPHYAAYCSKCDKITGHTTNGFDSTCEKCGHIGKAPYARWVLLPIIVIGLAAIPIYVIVTSVFVQQVLIACVVLVFALLLYIRFRNSRYYVLLANLRSKCASVLDNTKTALKLQ
jgi:hypothetical protein